MSNVETMIQLSPTFRFAIRRHRLRFQLGRRPEQFGFPNRNAFDEAWQAMASAIDKEQPQIRNDTCLVITTTLRRLDIPEFDFRAIAVARLVENVVHSITPK